MRRVVVKPEIFGPKKRSQCPRLEYFLKEESLQRPKSQLLQPLQALEMPNDNRGLISS